MRPTRGAENRASAPVPRAVRPWAPRADPALQPAGYLPAGGAMAYARNLVGGEWQGLGRRAIETTAPATGKAIGKAPRSGKAEVDRAVRAALEAFPAWAGTPAPRRGEVLFRAARLLDERKDALARVVNREMG